MIRPLPMTEGVSAEGGVGAGVVLEAGQRFADSMLWRLQRSYFDSQGLNAWRTATVPHYVTSNPALAYSYADILFGFLRDRGLAANAKGQGGGKPVRPLQIVELGAGCGRFGFLLLKQLVALCSQIGLDPVPLRYIMTDFTRANVDAWRAHPALRPFVTRGLLDFAVFDVERDHEFRLDEAGTCLTQQDTTSGLVVIANYVFDGISQDTFETKGGVLYERLATLTTTGGERESTDDSVFSQVTLSLESRPAAPEYYSEPAFSRLLRDYAAANPETEFWFPCAALRCLERLRRLSRGPLLLLAGDRGAGAAADGEDKSASILLHGSVSVPVNFAIVGDYTKGQDGLVLKTTHRQCSLDVQAFLFGSHPDELVETAFAYHRAFELASSDDFFRLRSGVQEHYPQLDTEHLLALNRLGRYDPRILRDCWRVFLKRAGSLSAEQKRELARVVLRTWENYFHIGEPRDLAFEFAVLLQALDRHAQAVDLYRHSLQTVWGRSQDLLEPGHLSGRDGKWAGCGQRLAASLEAGAGVQAARGPDAQRAG